MTVTILTKNVIDNIGAKYLQDTNGVDPIPPRGVLIQSIKEVHARLIAIMCNFIVRNYSNEADDSLSIEDTITFELRLSPRRAANKVQAITDLIHSYFVNAVLAKSYVSMGLADLAKMYESQSISDAQSISQLLNSKMPPIL